MKAEELVKRYGKKLKGIAVTTPAMGEYPGGKAFISKVIAASEDIVFFVKHPTWKDDEGCNEMGIFHYEEVTLSKAMTLALTLN